MKHLKTQILNGLRDYYKSEHDASLDNKNLYRFLGYWIHTISIIYMDRIEGTSIIGLESSNIEIANDLTGFMELAGTDEKWNKTIISGNLLKSQEINKIQLPTKNIFNRIFQYAPSIIIDYRLSYYEVLKKIISGFFPLKSKWFKCVPVFSVDMRQRLVLESYLLKAGIDKRMANIFSMSVPRIYIEGFDYYSDLYGGVCSKTKHIITSYSHFHSADFLYISLFFKDLKITIIEHGLESLNYNNGTFDFEYDICDEFYGNSNNRLHLSKYSKINKRKFEKLYTKKNNYKSNVCLIVNVTMPKYLLDFRSMPNTHDFKDYMLEVNKTTSVLDVHFDVMMKNYPTNQGWTDAELSTFGNWNYTKLNLKNIIKKSNIICVTYPGSLFFDCILNNLRTILVWDYNKYSLKDTEFQKILIDEKILFASSIQLEIYIKDSELLNFGIINPKLKKFVSENYQ